MFTPDSPLHPSSGSDAPRSDLAHQMLAGASDARLRLLRETVSVLQSSGEAAVDGPDIANRAGVAESAIRHHFGDVDGLIEAAQIERFRLNIDDMNVRFAARVRACRTRNDFVTAVRTTLADILTRDRQQNRLNRMSVLGSAIGRSALLTKLVEARRRGEASLLEALKFGRDKGWVRPDLDTKAATYWLAGVLTGRALLEIDQAVEPSVEASWNEIAVRSILTMLLVPDPSGADI